jgi:hypothetical protein
MGRKRATVELFEEIRREYEHGVGTVKGVARKLGVHRRMVREALADAIPRPKRKAERPRPALGQLIEFIDAILVADRKAPRKQRHTAHRIHQRLKREMPGHTVSESSVRRYVNKRKPELGWTPRETPFSGVPAVVRHVGGNTGCRLARHRISGRQERFLLRSIPVAGKLRSAVRADDGLKTTNI